LRRLAAEFVEGDHSRVVLVPGNHDVSWSRARDAMTALSDCPSDVARQSLDAESGLRWDWATQQAFKI
jgi:3',5'-cyclic AMP phosphodiesterase CpdA